jgi:hypothetical protein
MEGPRCKERERGVHHLIAIPTPCLCCRAWLDKFPIRCSRPAKTILGQRGRHQGRAAWCGIRLIQHHISAFGTCPQKTHVAVCMDPPYNKVSANCETEERERKVPRVKAQAQQFGAKLNCGASFHSTSLTLCAVLTSCRFTAKGWSSNFLAPKSITLHNCKASDRSIKQFGGVNPSLP